MIKELIKKYKAEFDHWMNGGKLQTKFKVGGWVIHNGEYKRVTKVKRATKEVDGYIVFLDKQPVVILKEESLELWKPKNNEYFWYKNDLVMFDNIQTNSGTLVNSACGYSYYIAERNFEDFCKPVIGKLLSESWDLNLKQKLVG